MAIYKPVNTRALALVDFADRANNQIVLRGSNQSYPVSRGIFFLEYLEPDKLGTVVVKDGKGNTMTGSINAFNNDKSPLRCDYGIVIVGDVTIAKGFFIDQVFEA